MTNSIYDALPIVANAFGEQIGVEVVLQHHCSTTAHTDDSVITLPMIESDSDSVDALWGLLFHEAGHHKWTEFVHDQKAAKAALKGKPSFFQSCWNMLEDVRMESRVMDDLPGSRGYLTAAVTYMQGQGALDPVQAGDPLNEVVGGWILGRGRSKALGQPLDALWNSAESLLKSSFGQTPIEEIGCMIDRASTCESAIDVVDLVDEIFEAFRALITEPEEPPVGPTGQGEEGECEREGEGEGGTGQQGDPADNEPQPPTTSSSESESESSTEGEESEGESGGDTVGETESETDSGDSEGEQEGPSQGTSDGEPNGESEDGEPGDGESGGNSGSSETENESCDGESGDEPGEPEASSSSSSETRGSSDHSTGDVMSPEEKDAVRQAIEEMIEQGVFDDVFDQLKRSLSREEPNSYRTGDFLLEERPAKLISPTAASDLLSKVERQSNACALALRSLVQSENRTSVRNAERGRKINSRKLARLSQGDARVFRKPDYREAPNTAIHLLVDVSGSMFGDDRIDIAFEVAMGLALALESIEGTSVGITAFDDEAWPILKQGESVLSSIENFGPSGTGSTITHRALLNAANVLSTCREPRKMIFVITDGEPDYRAKTIENVKRCEAAGIEVMAIGIQEDTVLQDYDLAVCIDSIDDLHGAVFGLMQNVLGGSNVA